MNRAFVISVAVFFIVHAALRLSVSQRLNYDEAEQALLVESFAWGYNLQPPLYTWLQIPWVALLGMNAAAFVIPKYLTTFLVFLAIYALGRRVLKNDVAAIAATLGLALFPEIAWEWLRERTHLILMFLACVLTLIVVLRLRDRQDVWGYVLMGLCIGCGVLTGATTFNTRWAQPFFVFVPIWLMLLLRGAGTGTWSYAALPPLVQRLRWC